MLYDIYKKHSKNDKDFDNKFWDMMERTGR